MRVIFEADDAVLKYDDATAVFTFVWNGVISKNTLRGVVTETAHKIERLDSASLFFDRRNLESYAPDAKDWFKNEFMKGDGKRLIKKVEKIAAVSSKSTFAQLVSTLLVGVLRLYNRSVQYKVFEDTEEAYHWLSPVEVV